MDQPNAKTAPTYAGTFYLHYLDGRGSHPLAKSDRLDSDGKVVRVSRPGKEIPFTVIDSGSRWCKAESDEFVIEFVQSWDGERTILYGRIGLRDGMNPNAGEDPPTGVWGADTQPPRGDDGQGNS